MKSFFKKMVVLALLVFAGGVHAGCVGFMCPQIAGKIPVTPGVTSYGEVVTGSVGGIANATNSYTGTALTESSVADMGGTMDNDIQLGSTDCVGPSCSYDDIVRTRVTLSGVSESLVETDGDSLQVDASIMGAGSAFEAFATKGTVAAGTPSTYTGTGVGARISHTADLTGRGTANTSHTGGTIVSQFNGARITTTYTGEHDVGQRECPGGCPEGNISQYAVGGTISGVAQSRIVLSGGGVAQATTNLTGTAVFRNNGAGRGTFTYTNEPTQ